jgi:uncharacterized protein YjbJ (UPF0337 family)
MNTAVNRDILMGKWKQVRGKVRQQWGKLTDNQVDQINGDYERLVGILQENYGYTRDKAMQEADMWITTISEGSNERMTNS